VLLPLAAPGQNLGRLALLSRLGEPLDAEIEVTAIPVEARDSLSAQIVPIGVFERFGVTPSPPLEVLRAAVERGADGLPVVRLKSTVPLDRPAVSVIVELAWNGGAWCGSTRSTSIRQSGRSRKRKRRRRPRGRDVSRSGPAAPAASPDRRSGRTQRSPRRSRRRKSPLACGRARVRRRRMATSRRRKTG
jgi:pilus assembly protein FimV